MHSRVQRLQEQSSTQFATAAPVTSSARTSSVAVAAAPAQDTRMDASLKELKNQYQQRLLALNSPATAPAPVATSATTAKKMTVITHVQPSIVSTLQQTTPQANSFQTIGQADTSSNVKAVIHNDKLAG
jgi:hypothetical protein